MNFAIHRTYCNAGNRFSQHSYRKVFYLDSSGRRLLGGKLRYFLTDGIMLCIPFAQSCRWYSDQAMHFRMVTFQLYKFLTDTIVAIMWKDVDPEGMIQNAESNATENRGEVASFH